MSLWKENLLLLVIIKDCIRNALFSRWVATGRKKLKGFVPLIAEASPSLGGNEGYYIVTVIKLDEY